MQYKEFTISNDIVIRYLKDNIELYKDHTVLQSYFNDFDFSKIQCRTFWASDYVYSIKNCLHGYTSDKNLVKQANSWVVQEVSKFLASGENRRGLFLELIIEYKELEDIYSSQEVSKPDVVMLSGSDEFFYSLDNKSDEDKITRAIRDGADGHFGIGFLVENCDVKNITISAIALATKKIVLTAYDEEGFIVIDKL